jgi:hypothetical protein
MCNICKITNLKVIDRIEGYLAYNSGRLTLDNKKALKEEFPNFINEIELITDKDCELHWNFHQTIKRVPASVSEENTASTPSLSKDINKDEAQVLSDLLNTQMATFTGLSNKINEVLGQSDLDMKGLIINPTNVQLYRETADSIRATVKEMRELNKDINGSKDSSLEGLKAIAAALSGKPQSSIEGDVSDSDDELTTDMYD